MFDRADKNNRKGLALDVNFHHLLLFSFSFSGRDTGVSLYVSHSTCLILRVSLYVSHSTCLILRVSLYVSHSMCLILCVSLYVSHSKCIYRADWLTYLVLALHFFRHFVIILLMFINSFLHQKHLGHNGTFSCSITGICYKHISCSSMHSHSLLLQLRPMWGNSEADLLLASEWPNQESKKWNSQSKDWNPEVESGIQGLESGIQESNGIQGVLSGIYPRSGIQNPGIGIQNPGSVIRNPRNGTRIQGLESRIRGVGSISILIILKLNL